MRKPLILGVIVVGVVVGLVGWLRRPAATTGSQPVVTSVSSAPRSASRSGGGGKLPLQYSFVFD